MASRVNDNRPPPGSHAGIYHDDVYRPLGKVAIGLGNGKGTLHNAMGKLRRDSRQPPALRGESWQ